MLLDGMKLAVSVGLTSLRMKRRLSVPPPKAMAIKKASLMENRSRASTALSDAFQGKPAVFQELSDVDQIISHYLEREEEFLKDTDTMADWLEEQHGNADKGRPRSD